MQTQVGASGESAAVLRLNVTGKQVRAPRSSARWGAPTLLQRLAAGEGHRLALPSNDFSVAYAAAGRRRRASLVSPLAPRPLCAAPPAAPPAKQRGGGASCVRGGSRALSGSASAADRTRRSPRPTRGASAAAKSRPCPVAPPLQQRLGPTMPFAARRAALRCGRGVRP